MHESQLDLVEHKLWMNIQMSGLVYLAIFICCNIYTDNIWAKIAFWGIELCSFYLRNSSEM